VAVGRDQFSPSRSFGVHASCLTGARRSRPPHFHRTVRITGLLITVSYSHTHCERFSHKTITRTRIQCLFVYDLHQCFPPFVPCYPKSHPDVGRYPSPPITHEQQYFSQKCPLISVAHPIKRVNKITINYVSVILMQRLSLINATVGPVFPAPVCAQ